MSIEPDPYRVLGLGRGASADEIRRAYRRLVKENHPDSAGEKALPRFLAIQAAYETLAGGPSIRRAGGRTAATRPAPRDPWRADPDRARTTRDTSARPGRAGRPASAADPGAKGSSGGPSAKDSAGTPGGSTGRGGEGVGSSQRPTGDRSRGDGRKRAPNKATLGSTSYDAAADEPFEPEWSGGTWYGASSGTYWTLNPKEYADPRKHGPEYQRRARRRTAGTGIGGADQRPDEPWDDDPGEPVEPPIGGPSDADGPSARKEHAARGATGRPPVGRQDVEGRGTRSAGPTRAAGAASSAWAHAADRAAPSSGSSD